MAVVPLPERQDSNDPTSPEALLISALLATGEFTPSKWQVSDADLACHEKLFRFCVDYQRRAGKAPSLELLAGKFPEYVFIPGIDVDWAASLLHDASFDRDIRRGLREVLKDLSSGDYTAVSAALQALHRPRRGQKLRGVPVFDPINVAERAIKTGIPVPYPALEAASGGIGMDELWLLAARTSVGKSFQLANYAAIAAEHGRKVRYVSLEMPARQVNVRIAKVHARNNKSARERLTNPANPRDREEALEEICAEIPGYVETIDPSMGRISTTTIEDACDDTDLLVIDHVGLLMLHDGRRAIEDWRVMAQVSNVIREVNLRLHTPILSASQINREGDRSNSAPKMSTISQSDALPQDATHVVTMSRYSRRTLLQHLGKNREGPETYWFSRFDPTNADYTEMTKDQAEAQKVRDDEQVARANS